MKKISSKANTNETAEACMGVKELSKKHPIADDAYFTITFEKLSALTADLIVKINAGWLTSELKEIDELRDRDVKALFYEVEAKCMRRPSTNQVKAMRVQAELDRYGIKITGSSYANQSAETRAMLSDLEAPELAKDIRSIPDFKQLVLNIKESQQKMDVATTKMIEGKLERENTKSASVIANELKDIFNNELSTYLTAMTLANPDKYKAFTDVLSTLIDENNSKVKNRLALLKRKREETEIE